MTTAFKNLTYIPTVDPDKHYLARLLADREIDIHEDSETLSHFLSADPTGSTWSTRGLVPATSEGDLIHDLDGRGVMLCIQFNERILPGKVRDERVAKIVADIAEREGRKLGKKEFREVRDEVELELLPKAFIRRTPVFVIVDNSDNLFIFTSSAKKSDDAIDCLHNLFLQLGAQPKHSNWSNDLIRAPGNFMTGLCLGEALEGYMYSFAAGQSGVLRNDAADDATHRIKKRDFAGHEVSTMVKQGYRPTEMEIVGLNGSDAVVTFKLTDKMIIKGFSFTDTYLTSREVKAKDPTSFHAYAWLTITTLHEVIDTLTAAINGETTATQTVIDSYKTTTTEEEL